VDLVKKAVTALKVIMTSARMPLEEETVESANAKLALIGQVAEETIEEIEEHGTQI
jgi:hypothetical protein